MELSGVRFVSLRDVIARRFPGRTWMMVTKPDGEVTIVAGGNAAIIGAIQDLAARA